MAERKILHLDLDAFFCSVEELLQPEMRGKAFAVGGSPSGRGVITSASYPARLLGVRSAMPSTRALQICPQLIFARRSHVHYSDYSDRVMAVLRDVTPSVQQVSVDEAYLDVSDMSQPLRQIALDIQQRVDDETQLPCSLGGATTKLVAKVANDYGKSSNRSGRAPRAVTIVPPGGEAAFLAPLDIQALLGIGPKSAQRLRGRGIYTIGQIAQLSQPELQNLFGKFALEMRDRALGQDYSRVHSGGEAKSISNETTFGQDIRSLPELLRVLRRLSDKVAFRLRRHGLAARVVQIKLRYSDFTTLTRQKASPKLTDLDDEIYALARQLMEANLEAGRPVRLLGVGASSLDKPGLQLSLFEHQQEKQRDLLGAVDALKERFGRTIITRASSLTQEKSYRDADQDSADEGPQV